MNVNSRKAIFAVLLAAAGSASGVVDTFAAADSEESLKEIVVTAQKREEALKDVPISLVVVSAEELSDRHITSLEDLPSAVPGLSYASAGNSHYIQILS